MENDSSRGEELQDLWNALRNDVLRSGADEHTAEDVVQETWLRALRRRPEERGRFFGWLHVVAYRRLREMRRSDRHRVDRERAVARGDRFAQRLAEEESRIVRYVEELPEPYLSVVRLRFLEDRDVNEIARLLQRSPETVRSQLKRGLKRLRGRLGDEDAGRHGPVWVLWLRRVRRAGSERRWTFLGASAAGLLATWLVWEVSADRARRLEAPEAIAAGSVARELSIAKGAEPERFALDTTARPPTVEPPALAARFAGVVRDPGGTPVPGARVVAIVPSTDEVRASTVSDERGRYELDADRNDILWASHEDWCPSPRAYAAVVRDPRAFDLLLTSVRTRLTVSVRDWSGTPVPDARVRVDPNDEPLQIAAANGALEFHFSSVEATTDAEGRSELKVSRSGRVALVVLAPGAPAWSGTELLRADEEAVDVVLPAPATLRGTCFDETGRRAAGVEVVVNQVQGLERRLVRTAGDGTFAFEALAPGRCVVRASLEPAVSIASARWEGELQSGAPREIELVLTPAATIHGVVMDLGESAAGALLTLQLLPPGEAEGPQRRMTRADDEGRFAFGGCASAGRYMLSVTPSGRGYARLFGPVTPSAEPRPVELRLTTSMRAPIEIEFTGASLPPWIEVVRDVPTTSAMLEDVDGSGRFVTEPFAAGPFEVVAWHPDVGTWSAGTIQHDPAVRAIHRFVAPEVAQLEVELALAPGVRADDVLVLLGVPGFNRFGLGSYGKQSAWRPLDWNAERGSCTTTVVPGEYQLVVQGDAIVRTSETIEVLSAKVNRWRRSVEPGIEVRLLVRTPRPLLYTELVQVEPLGADGATLATYRRRAPSSTEVGFLMDLSLPSSTAAVRVVTLPPPRNVPAGFRALEGRRALASGELAGEEPVRVEVQLAEEAPP